MNDSLVPGTHSVFLSLSYYVIFHSPHIMFFCIYAFSVNLFNVNMFHAVELSVSCSCIIQLCPLAGEVMLQLLMASTIIKRETRA